MSIIFCFSLCFFYISLFPLKFLHGIRIILFGLINISVSSRTGSLIAISKRWIYEMVYTTRIRSFNYFWKFSSDSEFYSYLICFIKFHFKIFQVLICWDEWNHFWKEDIFANFNWNVSLKLMDKLERNDIVSSLYFSFL